MTMYSKTLCIFGSGLLVFAVSAAPVYASQPDGAQYLKGSSVRLGGSRYLKDAKVALADARATALKTCSGKIISQELEKEHGGSGLRYSFDVRKKDGVVHEVGVDAKTGKVLENSIDNGND